MDKKGIESIINELKDIHLSLSSRINFSINNKAHAIYLLQGGIITSICSAYKFNKQGRVIQVAQLKRLVNEALDLILFFDEVTDDSRQINSWFKGRVIQRETGNSGNLTIEQRAKESNLSADQIKTFDSLGKKLFDELSKYTHPTINAMRVNVWKINNIFDYEHLNTQSAAMNHLDFVEFFIIPAINAMLISKNNFILLTTAQINKLNEFRKSIQPDIYQNDTHNK